MESSTWQEPSNEQCGTTDLTTQISRTTTIRRRQIKGPDNIITPAQRAIQTSSQSSLQPEKEILFRHLDTRSPRPPLYRHRKFRLKIYRWFRSRYQSDSQQRNRSDRRHSRIRSPLRSPSRTIQLSIWTSRRFTDVPKISRNRWPASPAERLSVSRPCPRFNKQS